MKVGMLLLAMPHPKNALKVTYFSRVWWWYFSQYNL